MSLLQDTLKMAIFVVDSEMRNTKAEVKAQKANGKKYRTVLFKGKVLLLSNKTYHVWFFLYILDIYFIFSKSTKKP